MTITKQDIHAVLTRLTEAFPQAFVLEQYQPHRPLKVGIFSEIAARCPDLARSDLRDPTVAFRPVGCATLATLLQSENRSRGFLMAMTIHDAKIAIGMLARGDNQHDVAAWFGENQARIVEASQGKFGTTEAAASSELPPKGPPGIKGRRLHAYVEKAIKALEDGDAASALESLRSGIDRYNRSE